MYFRFTERFDTKLLFGFYLLKYNPGSLRKYGRRTGEE